jgi:phosphate transport system substrate-binding protein
MKRILLTALLCAVGTALPAMPASKAIRTDPAVAFIDTLPPYRPRQRVSGTISLWGHGSFKRDFMGNLVKTWIADFQRHQPGVEFDYRMYGTASAIGALYTGAGDIAILGEEISPAADRAFRRAKGYAPTRIEIATGSVDVNFYDYAHMIFVHKDNPLRRLSLDQLRAIFGAGDGKSGVAIRNWGQLGLKGKWRDRRIQPYGWKTDVDFALFFRERVLGYSHRWNPDIQEFVHASRADGSQYDHGQRILDALSADHYGIAISNVRYATPDVRPLALAWRDGGPYHPATPATLISQAYPLTRIIPAYIDRPPGRPIEPAQQEFLRFILSREGQKALLDQSGYLPLGAEIRKRELAKLQ